MARPQPDILLENNNNSTVVQVLKAKHIYAVFYQESPINLRSINKLGRSGLKYKKVSFSNPGHAYNLAEMSNFQKIFEESQQALEDLHVRIGQESRKLKDNLKEQLDVKLDADRIYESRWVIYHTILGAELLVVIIILAGIWWKL